MKPLPAFHLVTACYGNPNDPNCDSEETRGREEYWNGMFEIIDINRLSHLQIVLHPRGDRISGNGQTEMEGTIEWLTTHRADRIRDVEIRRPVLPVYGAAGITKYAADTIRENRETTVLLGSDLARVPKNAHLLTVALHNEASLQTVHAIQTQYITSARRGDPSPHSTADAIQEELERIRTVVKNGADLMHEIDREIREYGPRG